MTGTNCDLFTHNQSRSYIYIYTNINIKLRLYIYNRAQSICHIINYKIVILIFVNYFITCSISCLSLVYRDLWNVEINE
jgi:hypothetical protein